MGESLFSAQWYRVARAKPQLRSQVLVQRQHWRDQRWYVLSDAVTGRQHRINEAAYQFIGRCDGNRTVHDVWTSVLEAEPDEAPTQDDVLQLLGKLNEKELLQADLAVDTERVIQRSAERHSKQRFNMLNPFSFKLPLGDPDKLLIRLDPMLKSLFTMPVLWAWLGMLLVTMMVAGSEWQGLVQHAQTQLLSPASILMAWLLYPLMKALHELAHAMTVRRFGGEVHECGIALMFLVPAPYVDASAATAFPRRRDRMMVGAAGVLVESALAIAAFWLWWATAAGWVHDAAFVLMFLGAGSTLLFNANPLLKFDGYYVMCDLFDVPNLASRSQAYWAHHLSRCLLRAETELPVHARSERKWLFVYAPLSWLYRIGISVSLVLWLGGKWVLLGFLAALYGLVTVMFLPLYRWSRQALSVTSPGRDLARVKFRLGFLGLGIVLLVFVVPMPYATVAPGVVWLPEDAHIRPELDGFIEAMPVADGTPVKVGDLLVQLVNPELDAAQVQLVSQLERMRVEQHLLLLRDAAAAQNLGLDIERVQAELSRAQEKIARLQIRAQTSGRLVIPHADERVGTYVRQGSTLGYVLEPGELRIRSAVASGDAHLVTQRTRSAQVRLAEWPGRPFKAAVLGDTPSATRQLPSAALSQAQGGPYLTDDTDKKGLQTLEPVFVVDLTVGASVLRRVGGRAWVRFDHGSAPLASQLYRTVMQLFLKHFDAGS